MTTIKDNISRINAALASDKTSDTAKAYLNQLIEQYEDVKTVAGLTGQSDEIGIAVVQSERSGKDYVHYGDYGDASGFFMVALGAT